MWALLKAHATREQINNIIDDITDTDMWREEWFGENGLFGDSAAALAIALQLSTDGMNPFQDIWAKYSMWPIYIALLNFPPTIRKSLVGK